MAIISCPHCSKATHRAGFPVWTIITSIVLFPFGLLALLVGRKPTICHHCDAAFPS